MAGGKGNALKNQILDKDFGATNYTPPATYYVALFTVSPTAAGGGTEMAYGGYARVAITNNPANWPNAVSGRKSNANAITFPLAASPGGIAVAFGLFDMAAGGVLWRFGPVSPSVDIPTGKTPQFSVGALVLTET